MLTVLLPAVLALAAPPDSVLQGRRIFFDPSVGKNGVACATCHSTEQDEAKTGDGMRRAGHSLWGVAHRPHWRGDSARTAYRSLGAAVEVCTQLFQGGTGLSKSESRLLVKFLQARSPKRAQPPIQIAPGLEANQIYDRPKYERGLADRGRKLFFQACHQCHPNGNQGLGPSLRGRPVGDVARKIREGNGLLRGARTDGDWMPFFGTDRLSDAEVADVAAFVASMATRGTDEAKSASASK